MAAPSSATPRLRLAQISGHLSQGSPRQQDGDASADIRKPGKSPCPGNTAKDVLVVGAGPAGLMLAANLARYGVNIEIVDNRPDRTATGRADGLQPKSIETFRQMRLYEPLMKEAIKVYDICFWRSTAEGALRRTGREVHYPSPVVDVTDPNLVLSHQGAIEKLFIDDLDERGVPVQRNHAFQDLVTSTSELVTANCLVGVDRKPRSIQASYVVGCDGAHSKVRKCIPDAQPVGASSEAIWGVLDGELDTNFPDIWSKTVVYAEGVGSVLIIPRERDLTRLYIELKPDTQDSVPQSELTQEHVMAVAQKIMKPYCVKWKTVEWFGRYQIGQRVAARFADKDMKVFIAGDASHTHSPKAAQGMNTSIHDSWNLAWKMNLAVRALAKPSLLATYEQERHKIADDLINFDYEHANAFAAGDSKALAENFKTNVRFIAGVGAEYDANVVNQPSPIVRGLRPGCLLTPARATRYIDANPVDLQLDIPMLGQFRIYIFTHNVQASKDFLETLSSSTQSTASILQRATNAAAKSYSKHPQPATSQDAYTRPERYTPVSKLFTWALVTDMNKSGVEIADLPKPLQKSCWTFYLDDVPHQATLGQSCMEKWLGGLHKNEVAIMNVRPDGYIGSVRRWSVGNDHSGLDAAKWLDEYYSGFLQA